MADPRTASDALAGLLRRERQALGDFIAALADFHRERHWVELGYTSLFYYLHRELGLSKGAAFYRKIAAELVLVPGGTLDERVPPMSTRSAPISSVEPLTAELHRLHVTVSRRVLDKLAAARDALSHANPHADTGEVLEAALDALLEKARRRKGLVERPRSDPGAGSSRPEYIPAATRRAVWARDEGRCQWPMQGGGICGATRRLQFDHIVPRALGGTSEVGKLRLLCSVHNGLAARKVLGDACMDRYARQGQVRLL